MKKRGHIIVGFLLSFFFIYLTIYLGFSLFDFNFYSIAIITAVIILYSLLPDIDHKNSTITWFFLGFGILGVIIGLVGLIFKLVTPNPLIILSVSAFFLVLTFIAGNFLKHRGFIHSIPLGLVVVFPLWLLFNNISYCIIAYISWHSHLIGDGYLFKIK